MCGIAGIKFFNNKSVNSNVLKRMLSTLKHRGPDGEGIFIKKDIGLGHRRLKIIDLSENGNQPMSNEDESIWLTSNGEIYNYKEIKKELLQKGHIFSSETDIEVIIHAYEEWGIDCLKKFNGMFAFALYDFRIKKLYLVRDRFGIKPLFYFMDKEKIVFASEIKAILELKDIKREIDPEALHNYLSLNYMTAPLTMFRNIFQILPGYYLEIKDNNLIEKKYWDIQFKEEKDHRRSDNLWMEEFDSLLEESVKRRLVSDVPFGAFLSGGIDSSSIVSYMKKILGENVNTFSIGFKEESFNEVEDSIAVSKKLMTKHFTKTVNPEIDEAFLNKIVWHSEEPTADSSIIPMFHLSEMTKRHVTMALSGDGADELLAGYETYQAYYIRKIYRCFPVFVRKGFLKGIIGKLPVSLTKVSFDYKLKVFSRGAELSADESHFYWRKIFDEELKNNLYLKDVRNNFRGYDSFKYIKPYFDHAVGTPLNRMLEFDTRFYLPNDMLVKVDRASMANSLEVRVPFLDHKLVEFISGMPENLKLKYYYKRKYVLRKVMKNRLPKQILQKKKLGFNTPVNVWIKGPLYDLVRDTLSESTIKEIGIFDFTFISRLLDQHRNGSVDHGYRLWNLLIFVMWWKRFIKNS